MSGRLARVPTRSCSVAKAVRQGGKAIGERGRRADGVGDCREHRELGHVGLRRRHGELPSGMNAKALLRGRGERRRRLIRDRDCQRAAPSGSLDDGDDGSKAFVGGFTERTQESLIGRPRRFA